MFFSDNHVKNRFTSSVILDNLAEFAIQTDILNSEMIKISEYEECLDLVAERKKAKLVDFERYRQLNRDIRRMMKRDHEAYWDQVAHDLEEAASRHKYRTLYRTLRGLSGKSKSTNDNIKKADGTFVCSTA
ncbi:hypothetical protein ROHU_020085 [Labeo rohita]|uniref:Uncharacterized protein n=1 Tax=Labeo rohita TaxID=84645 RepID=A0A498N5B4_LABRO|nr:hypothetical protein ROHU_020085 [Labeo rohita]